MLIRTFTAVWAVALEICFAGWAIRVEAKSVFTSKKLAEFEVVLRRPSLRRFLPRHRRRN